jgi:hypothetical protein
VPFADIVRTISKLSQIFRQDLLVQWQSSGLGTFENLNYSWNLSFLIVMGVFPFLVTWYSGMKLHEKHPRSNYEMDFSR